MFRRERRQGGARCWVCARQGQLWQQQGQGRGIQRGESGENWRLKGERGKGLWCQQGQEREQGCACYGVVPACADEATAAAAAVVVVVVV